MKKIASALLILSMVSGAFAQTANWTSDASHSSMGFSVMHMVLTPVNGTFDDFSVKMTTSGKDFSTAKIEAVAKVASINTKTPDRDNHLKSADFFDMANHPDVKFVSTRMEKTGEGSFKIHGNLTMRGVTKPVVFDAKLAGQAKDAWGNYRSGWVIAGTVDRYEWGLVWNQDLTSGGLLVGREVTIAFIVQMMTKDINS